MPSLVTPWRDLGKLCSKPASRALFFLILCYRAIGTLFFGGACRFEPSCSEYAAQAVQQHDFLSAVKLIVVRLAKCRPGGSYGIDPVPLCKNQNQHHCRGLHGKT